MAHLTQSLVITSCLFTGLAILFVGGRFYVRAALLRSLKWDDYWVGLAMVFGMGCFAVVMTFTFRDIPNMNLPSSSENFNRWYWDFGNLNVAAMALSTMQNTCARLSLLFSYRRFTPREHVSKLRWRTLNTLAILSAMCGFSLALLEIAPCYPFHVMYYPNFPWQSRKGGKEYTCLPPRVPFWWRTVTGVALDFGVYLMPFWLLLKVSFVPHRRWDVYALFAFGGIVFGLSMARVPLVMDTLIGGKPLFTVHLDRMILTWLITIIESHLIVIAASIPTLRPLMNRNRLKMEFDHNAKHQHQRQQEEVEIFPTPAGHFVFEMIKM